MGTKESRRRKKPKQKKGNGNGDSQDSRDAHLRRDGETDLKMRMFGLTASIDGSNQHRQTYLKAVSAAQRLGVDVLDARDTLDVMVMMGALERAGRGSYTPTSRFDSVYANYQAEKQAEGSQRAQRRM